MPESKSIFRSPELERRYLGAYEAVLALWPVPHESLEVPTRFGITHINVSGSRDKPAMVLLPGFGANSTMWFPNISALSSQYCVYALDTIGQPGKSVPGQGIRASNSADWIVEVLDGLGLKEAHVVGISLGGWLTLNLAIRAPERVNRIVLLDPAASFVGMSASFVWHSLIPIMIYPTRAGLIRYFRWMTQGYQVNRRWGELMLLGILNTRPQPPIRATVFRDDDLRQVKAPVLLLIGGRSVIYEPRRVLQRATQLLSNIEAEIIPNASHALNAERAEEVNTRLLQFCQ